jgi:hypothetical protein
MQRVCRATAANRMLVVARRQPAPASRTIRAVATADRTTHTIATANQVATAAILVLLVMTLLVPLASSASEDSSDILPPVITIIRPERGASLISPRSVTIEVEYSDLGSGVDPASAYLLINRLDVTPDIEATEEGASYVLTGLREGTYSIRFGVSDRAGNRAEVAWDFGVRGVFEGFGLSGKSDLSYRWKPLRKMTESLELALTGTVTGYSLDARAKLRVTDYPGGSPLHSVGRFNLYFDKWSVALTQGKRSLSAGDIAVPVYFELVEVGQQMSGIAGQAPITVGRKNLNVQAFSGRIVRSIGLGMTIMDSIGIRAEYDKGAGTVLSASYVSLGKSNGYDVISLTGRGLLGACFTTAELVYGKSQSSGIGGFGLVTRIDTVLGSTNVGGDLYVVEQNYPYQIAPSRFSSANGGALGLALRTNTRLGGSSTLRLEGALVRDNLSGSRPTTSQRVNATIGYQYRMSQGWTLSANHAYEHKTVTGGSGPGANSTARSYGLSANGSVPIRGADVPTTGILTVKQSDDAVTLRRSVSQTLTASMTVNVKGQRLTPTLTLSHAVNTSGMTTDSFNLQLGSLNLSLPLAINAQVSFSAKGSRQLPEGSIVPDKTTTDAGASISLTKQVFGNSTASAQVRLTRWSTTKTTTDSGWDQDISFGLTTIF